MIAKFPKNRSRHRRCSLKKGVLKSFAKFTGKHLCQSLFFNKVEKFFKKLFHQRDSVTGAFL